MAETHGVFCPFNKGDCYRPGCVGGCEANGVISKGNADAFIAGFRAAQRLAYEVVVVHTDGDSPFDGTIARMADAIDRMPLPSAPEAK